MSESVITLHLILQSNMYSKATSKNMDTRISRDTGNSRNALNSRKASNSRTASNSMFERNSRNRNTLATPRTSAIAERPSNRKPSGT